MTNQIKTEGASVSTVKLPFEWGLKPSGRWQSCTFIVFDPVKGWAIGDSFLNSDHQWFADPDSMCDHLASVLRRFCHSCARELRQSELPGHACGDCTESQRVAEVVEEEQREAELEGSQFGMGA